MRVLIVDDHEIVRRGLKTLLMDEHIEVCGEAADGVEAVAKAEQLNPSVIIMDLVMPRMDGFRATREIRRLLPQIQIVIVSQHDAPVVRSEALKAGATTFISKDAIHHQLIRALRDLSPGGK